MSPTERHEIAKTIIEQLGGPRFLVMTGCKNLTYGETDGQVSLTIKLTKNKLNATHLRITLTLADDYTLTFIRVRKFEMKNVLELTGIYCDQLESTYAEVTGQATRL